MAASDYPTPADQAAAVDQVVSNGWGTRDQVLAWIANESGPRTSVARILTAWAPNTKSAVAAGAAVNPAAVTTVAIAQQYDAYAKAGLVDESTGRFTTPGGAANLTTSFATPTPNASALGDLTMPSPNDGVLHVSAASGAVPMGAALAASSTPTANTPAPLRLVVSNGAPVSSAPAASGVPTWAWLAIGAAVLYLLVKP